MPDPDYAVYGIFHSSQITGMNKAVYSNPEADRLMDLGRTLKDGPEREKVYHDLQVLLREQAPWVYVENGEQVVGIRKNVKGFVPNPAGYHRLSTVFLSPHSCAATPVMPVPQKPSKTMSPGSV